MRDMRALIRRLADEGMTVLLSSHLLTEVEELCNRVAIIRRGRIVYEGALAELAHRRAAATGCARPTTRARCEVCRGAARDRRRRALDGRRDPLHRRRGRRRRALASRWSRRAR